MSKKPSVPASLNSLVKDVGDPVEPTDVDTFARWKETVDQSHRVRTIVNAWKKQQDQERTLRSRYALTLISAMLAQAAAINVIFILVGAKVLEFDAWTARIFIMAVFSEIAAMVFFIVKYLFRPGADEVLRLAEVKPVSEMTAQRGKRGDRLS